MKRFRWLVGCAVLVMGLVLGSGGTYRAVAQEASPPAESLEKLYPGRPYSPYAGDAVPTRVYWGDTHVHTEVSMDAGAFGARLSPEDAYRFARGEEVRSSTGQRARLARPLDFLVVADHTDGMGLFPDLLVGDPALLADPMGRRWYDMIMAGQGAEAALELIDTFSRGEFPPALMYDPSTSGFRSQWDRTIAAAESYYEPGRFTAFIGYEWTSLSPHHEMHGYAPGALIGTSILDLVAEDEERAALARYLN